MTVIRLSYDCHLTVICLSYDCHMPVIRLSYDCHTTVIRLSYDYVPGPIQAGYLPHKCCCDYRLHQGDH